MKEPTREQIKEFWEWCGWKFKLGKQEEFGSSELSVWIPPNGYDGVIYLCPPDIDLNNLFKYAVPKLLRLRDVGFIKWDGFRDKNKYTIFSNGKRFADTDDPALALFWALWQVREK